MNELTNANHSGGLSLAENLAREAQFYSMQTQFNMLQLGRVLTEAKEVVERGQWLKWIDENAGCSERQAQIFMQLYETYGLSQEMAALGTSKLKILLPMTDEERDKLLAEKDVKKMSARALKDEVKAREAAIRAEEQEKAREAVAAEQENGKRLAESAARKAEKETRERLEEEMEILRAERADYALKAKELQERAELAEGQLEGAINSAREASRSVSEQSAALDAERRRIERELKAKDEALEELQEQYDELNRKYLDNASTIARGDADRSTADILSAEAIHASVRDFMDTNSRLPYMHSTFAAMGATEHERIKADLLALRDFTEKALAAMETIVGNGGVVE